MASNTLLAGELARRNKDREPTNEAITTNVSLTNANNKEHIQLERNASGLNWKVMLDQFPQQQQKQNATFGELNQEKTTTGQHYKNSSFSMALHNLIGSDHSTNSSQLIVDESTKINNHHLSDPSSLVTSLDSSREGSPDKSGTAVIPFVTPSIYSSWITSSQSRAAQISTAQLPVFAAWNSS